MSDQEFARIALTIVYEASLNNPHFSIEEVCLRLHRWGIENNRMVTLPQSMPVAAIQEGNQALFIEALERAANVMSNDELVIAFNLAPRPVAFFNGIRLHYFNGELSVATAHLFRYDKGQLCTNLARLVSAGYA